MIVLKRVSTDQPVQSWNSVPAVFLCSLGEVNGATVGWMSGDFELIEEADPEPDAPTQPELRAHAASTRFQIETSGTAWNGHTIQTDRESQSKLIAEFVAISAGLRTEPALWKFADGFVSLTNAEMAAVIMAARAHVSACFDKEAEIVAGIESEDITTRAEIDTADWPSNA